MRYSLNVEKLKEFIKFKPHPGQEQVLKKQRRFTIICAGRRFGKTILCAYLALRELWGAEKKVWIVAPNYELSKKVFDYLVFWVVNFFDPEDFKINYSEKVIHCLATKSFVMCKSAENPDSLIGDSLDLLIMDEAARIQERIWQSFLRPCLTDRNGRAIFISTPLGKNWFHRLWNRGQTGDEKDKNYISFQFKTIDNPTIPNLEEDIAEARESLPRGIFLTEYEASFEDGTTTLFRNISSCVGGKEEEPKINHLYVIGVDLGRLKDYTVVCVIDREDHHLVKMDRFKTIPWGLQKKRIRAIAQDYNDALVFVDSTGVGDPIFEDLVDMNLSVEDYKFTNKSKRHLIDKLVIFIQQKKLTFPNIPVLISELETFAYTKTDKGNVTYSAPAGFYDDCVASLALAIWDLPNERPGTIKPLIFDREGTDW